MPKTRCAACGRAVKVHPRIPQQRYCPEAACQRERRRRWQSAKRRSDPDYRENQSRAQKAWTERHRTYWRAYRDTHVTYTEGNRAKQVLRDSRRRERLAKMDASTAEPPLVSGIYRLSPANPPDLAKMDAWTVELTLLSRP